jgi:hypothetical protein
MGRNKNRHRQQQRQRVIELPPKPVQQEIVRRTERHFYQMPVTADMFLAALTALQDYHKWVKVRGIDPLITVYCPNPELAFLLPALTAANPNVQIEEICHVTTGQSLERYEQAVNFDPLMAYKIGMIGEKHVTQVFGMMVGSDPMKVLPDISSVVGEIEPQCDIVVFPFPGQEVLFDLLYNNMPELNLQSCTREDADTRFSALRGKLIIAARSGVTYLAASANRAVVEIYPQNQHRNWVSKWANPHYQMIYGNPGDVTPELVFRAVQAVWRRVARIQRALEVFNADNRPAVSVELDSTAASK